ncbi:fatty acid desaturase [Psychrobacter sp. H8-1]|uniref:fatty acid desaturase family protein n=1 Tax=Psychrobacter sp. H8-1 TaxID=2774129 RepID=UPI001919AB97|nr:fatty acid desaturase [Psychrobacter sp. H8-1]
MKANKIQSKKRSAIKHALSSVEWQDLRQLSRVQIVYNVILPYPFLLLSWWFASQSWYVLACGASYFFFAAAFRQAHDGYHHSLGTSKRTTTGILLLLSVLLMTGLHSIRATHMEHHRNPLGDSDIEGALAKLSWWQALLGGVTYRLDIYRQGLRLSSRRNRRLAWLEFASIILVVMAAIGLSTVTAPTAALLAQVLVYHILTMTLANVSVGIIAVWGVHHDCDETVARTERNKLVNALTFNLLYHVEHHLFPAVPSNHLPELAKRLDAAAPHLTNQQVLPRMSELISFIKNLWNKIKDRYHHSNDDGECPIRKRFA